MQASEFDAFRKFSIDNYARALSRNLRITFRDAMDVAEKESTGELPQGYYSDGHYFFHILHEKTDDTIGHAWIYINAKRKSAFLFDIWIGEDARGRGYAQEAIEQLCRLSKREGARTFRLNVFGDNRQARHLYDKLGFEECNTIMQRLL